MENGSPVLIQRGGPVGFETQDVERKIVAILRILSESSEPVGARVSSYNLDYQTNFAPD